MHYKILRFLTLLTCAMFDNVCYDILENWENEK